MKAMLVTPSPLLPGILRALVLVGIAALSAALHAEVVTLQGPRTIRVTGITEDGAKTQLQLLTGGILTVPTAEIQSIAADEVAPGICRASPYRCQDRAMLLSRRARAAGLTKPETPPAASPESKP